MGGDALVKLQDVVADGSTIHTLYILQYVLISQRSICYNSSSSSAFLVCELELWIHHRTSM